MAGFAVAFAMPRGEVSGLLDLTAERLPAPPEVRLLSPADGEGVGAEVVLAGQALSLAREVIDVQYRLDGGRWTSVPDAPRGQRSVPFSLTLPLEPGDHLLEARAWDGDAYSLAARALVRRDAPTTRIVSPEPGEGVASGVVEVHGVVVGRAERVHVETGEASVTVNVTGGAWTARVPMSGGVHVVRATALAAVPSLPARVLVAAGDPAPASVRILAPREGAAYGETGDLACGGGCILFTGTSRAAGRIHAALDGLPAGEARVLPTGAWEFRLPMVQLASGPHAASFTPEGGAPQNVTFLARTPLELVVEGDTAPRHTRTSLSFRVWGEGVSAAEWTLDGAPAGTGATVSLFLARPGDHALSVRSVLANGRSATTGLTLHALNRGPTVHLDEPALVGADIRLEATSSDPDGFVASYLWEFGDGETRTTGVPSVTHRYLERGAYTASVTAVDDGGLAVRDWTLVVVPNVVPLANFSWEPAEPTILDVVRFRDTSVDLDGVVHARSWTLPGGNTSANATPAMRMPARGAHPVTLTVVDDAGAEAVLTRLVHVADLPPRPAFSWIPAVPRVHDEVFFVDASTDLDGPIAARAWDFGDKTNGTGAGVVHAFAQPGLYNVTLTVVDDVGVSANLTLPIRVADGEPTVTAVVADPPRPRAQDEVRLRVLAADREGDVVALAWELGDGTNSTEREPLHRYPRSGTYKGSVTVFDEAGLSTVFPFSLEVANAPPTGTIALAKGGFAALPSTLVANATDVDGRIALYRFDADGDGRTDCETTSPECVFTFADPGAHLMRVWIEDDEAAIVEAQAIVDILAPPSHLAPPVVTIESPTREGLLRGDHLVRGDAKGVRPIAKVELQFRNDSWAYSGTKDAWRLANGGLAWSSLVDTRGLHDGEYDLVVRATDEGGGQGYARLPVRVMNGARPSEVSLQVLDPPGEIDDDAFVRGSAFHPQGVTSVRWRIDDAPWRYVSTSPLAFTIHLDRDLLDAGSHLLLVEAYRGPTEKATLEHPFLVVGATPSLVVDEPPAPVAYGLIRASGRIVGDGHAQWRLDHDVWRDLPGDAIWTLDRDTMDLAGGRHRLDVRAVSPDGRLASDPASWTLDVVNPPFTTSEPRHDGPPPITMDVPGAAPWLALAAAVAAALARRRAGRG